MRGVAGPFARRAERVDDRESRFASSSARRDRLVPDDANSLQPKTGINPPA